MPEITPEQSKKWGIIQDHKVAFGSESGRRVLEQFKTDWLYRPSFSKDPLEMAFMEGERHVVLTILKRLSMELKDIVIVPTEAITQEEDSNE